MFLPEDLGDPISIEYFLTVMRGFIQPWMEGSISYNYWMYTKMAFDGNIPYICPQCAILTWGERDYIHNNLLSVKCDNCGCIIRTMAQSFLDCVDEIVKDTSLHNA